MLQVVNVMMCCLPANSLGTAFFRILQDVLPSPAQQQSMPIYMDVHIVPGVNAKDVAEAHRKDLFHQEKYSCKCMTYWIDEERGTIFCLIDAPDKETVEKLHKEAHGLIPNKIIEVSSNVVESFLGRIYDPAETKTFDDGLKVFSDPSFRVLLVTKTTDAVLLRQTMGIADANELLKQHTLKVRRILKEFNGRETEHPGNDFVIAFGSASDAIACAMTMVEDTLVNVKPLELKIAIHAGEPVEKNDELFGDSIRLAKYLCLAANPGIALSNTVKELASKDLFTGKSDLFYSLSPQDEMIMLQLFDTLEAHWQEPEFNLDDYCQSMAMSKSQLYRKTIALTGYSPNLLLRQFRLDKAREMMKKQFYNISQVTFDAGFTSPSYFTKCFKKTYGLLPMSYVELLQ